MTAPFLKWAGGKRWLVSSGRLPVPPSYNRFIEPFLGGGAVFFHLKPQRALLSDANRELIELYTVMRDNPDALQNEMTRYQGAHSDIYYYHVRSQSPSSALGRAARFLYLNRTCWNGLYRVNLSGQFNVPRGTKDTVVFDDEDFGTFAASLNRAEILCSDFEPIIDRAEGRDLVFIDPPYTVKHNANGFVKYNEHIFRWDDQIRLRDAVHRACKRGAYIVMTNADHESVRDLYDGILDYRPVYRSSVLAGSAARRGKTTEALLTYGLPLTNPDDVYKAN